MKQSLKILTVLCAAIISVFTMSFAASAVNTETNYLRGDANGDGRVDIDDVTAIQRHLGKIEAVKSENAAAAAVTGGAISINDATAIQRYIAEFADPYQINKRVTTETTEPATYYIKPGDNELPFIPN